MPKSPTVNTRDIHPLTDFVRHPQTHIARLKESGAPAILTVNGKAEIVVQTAAAYQDLLDRLERSELLWSLQSSLESLRAGHDITIDELKDKLWKQLEATTRRPRRGTKKPPQPLAKPKKHLYNSLKTPSEQLVSCSRPRKSGISP